MPDYSVLADEIERLAELWTHASAARLKAIAAELRGNPEPAPEPVADQPEVQ